MPSQEPAVDDKDDDVDLPSEETGGSRAAPPTPGRLLPSPPDHGPSLDPTCHPKAMSASTATSQRGWGRALQAPHPRADLGGAGALPGTRLRALLSRASGAGVSPLHRFGSSTQCSGHVPAPPTDRLCTGHAVALFLEFCGIFFFWWIGTFLMLRSVWREILIAILMWAQL